MKKELTNWNFSKNCCSRWTRSHSEIRAGSAREMQVEEMHYPEPGNWSAIYLKIMVPYQDNLSEEAISESCKIKEQHETIKLLKKDVTMLQQARKL